jgi:hypothetical protein
VIVVTNIAINSEQTHAPDAQKRRACCRRKRDEEMKIHPVILLKLLGLRRDRPKTKLGRIVRRGEYTACVMVAIYMFIQFFPQLLFANNIQTSEVQVFSTEPIAKDVESILLAIRARLNTSAIHQENSTCRVFVCNSRWLYAFFCPTVRGSFGRANIYTRSIFVADADIKRNQARRFGVGNNTRSFTSVVVHEAGHILLRDHFGVLAAWKLPTWLQEGYCEMLAGESSFPEGVGDSVIAREENDGSMSFKYFTYRRMVEYLIKGKNMAIEDLVRNTPDEEIVRKNTCVWIRNKISEQPHAADGEERRR